VQTKLVHKPINTFQSPDDMDIDEEDTFIVVMTVHESEEEVLYDIQDFFCECHINEVRNSIFRDSNDGSITWTLEYKGDKYEIIKHVLKTFITENCITTPVNIFYNGLQL
jgi:mannitol/fructose-specific phosphotransferase system IIA component